jgi:hypothetical protein
MADLGKKLDEIESLKDKKFKLFGISMTPTTIGAAVALLGSVIGMLYAGFVMYQKIDSIANLDVEAFDNRMKVIEAKVEETVEYTRDIKNGLRDDILRIEQQSDRTEDLVRETEDKVRTMIDDAEMRFETKREQLYMSNKADLKELEDRLNKKVQRALDNPLAN